MDLLLIRNSATEDGIFGTLHEATGDCKMIAVTLEHAYDPGFGDGSYAAKILAGTYTCERYLSPKHGYEVFRLLSVPGSDYDEIHVGNYNKDSDGCILLGRRVAPSDIAESGDMITSSRNTFNAFMDLQRSVDQFVLTIKDS